MLIACYEPSDTILVSGVWGVCVRQSITSSNKKCTSQSDSGRRAYGRTTEDFESRQQRADKLESRQQQADKFESRQQRADKFESRQQRADKFESRQQRADKLESRQQQEEKV